MSAAYDTYDYPTYWITREYEHRSEEIAINNFLQKIKKVNRILDVGAGFGRLTSTYLFRAKNVVLSDPSIRLLRIAKDQYKGNNIKFIQSTVQNLPKKVKNKSFDMVLMIRVLHHIKDPQKAFGIINKVLKRNGYFILEFPNKKHLKETLKQFLKGNITYPLDIFPRDLSKKPKSTLPFINYHPDIINEYLIKAGFNIIETRSVSNIRSPFIKKFLTTDTCLFLERILQKPFSYINFGPSVFVLAQKN